MKQHVIEHFKKADPILFEYIAKVDVEDFTKHEDLFESLCDEIVSQQLSGKAASTIFGRFLKLFPNEKPTPEELIKIPDESIRAAGCSWAKIRSLKDLADHVLTKKLQLDKLNTLSNEELIKELTQVKGIGPWTAEMFMMFTLGREDIFSHGDLGLRKGIQKIYGFKKEPTVAQIEKIIKNWSPYKTYAARILWKSLELKD